MTLLVVVLGIILVIALTVLIVMTLTKKALNAALGSLLGILGALVTATVAPSVQGQADILLEFGPFGHITARYLQVNGPQPSLVWYTAFVAISLLTSFAMYLVYDTGRRRS